MTRHMLAALALVVAMQFSLPAMAAHGSRARDCREECRRQPCQASATVCEQMLRSCVADCR
jgi:hypothetical protein